MSHYTLRDLILNGYPLEVLPEDRAASWPPPADWPATHR